MARPRAPARKKRASGTLKKASRDVGRLSATRGWDGSVAVTRKSVRTVATASAEEPPGVAELQTRSIGADRVIAFEVHGLPIPQGSTRVWMVNGKPITTSSARGLGAWRRLVADVAQGYAPKQLWEGPVAIQLHFGLPKPKSAPKTRRVWPDKRPDLDKLTRAVLDALTYVVFGDDSQVVEIQASKDYGAPGVVIEVRRILTEEPRSD